MAVIYYREDIRCLINLSVVSFPKNILSTQFYYVKKTLFPIIVRSETQFQRFVL